MCGKHCFCKLGNAHLYVHRSTRSIKSDKMLPPQAAKQHCVNMIFKKKKKKKRKRTTEEEDRSRKRRRAKCSRRFFSPTERLLIDNRPSDTRRTIQSHLVTSSLLTCVPLSKTLNPCQLFNNKPWTLRAPKQLITAWSRHSLQWRYNINSTHWKQTKLIKKCVDITHLPSFLSCTLMYILHIYACHSLSREKKSRQTNVFQQ